MFRRFLVGAAFAFALAGAGAVVGCGSGDKGGGAKVKPAGADLVDSVTPRIERYIEETMGEWDVPSVAAGIVADDRLVWWKGFGKRADGGPIDRETLFEIGSSSKAFLGVTEAILAERGELDWNDRVISHYPDFRMNDPWVTREFRMIDLLAQRSGLAAYAGTLFNTFIFDSDTAIKGLETLEPSSSFRSEFAYQNVPHLVAGEIVAEKAGAADWNEAVGKLLLDPLGMKASRTGRDALTANPNSTRGHQLSRGEVRELEPVGFPSNGQGAGSIVSNLDDMTRWLRFQINRGELDGDQLLSEEQIEVTRKPLVAVEGPMADNLKHGRGPASIQYGTGWFIHSLPEGRIIEHGGNTLGYGAAVRFDPDRRLGLVILTNLNVGDGAGGYSNPIAKYAMDLLQGREPLDYARSDRPESETPPAREKPARPLGNYVGRYRHPGMGTIKVRRRGDGLTYRIGEDDLEVRLMPVGEDRFLQTFYLENNRKGPVFEFEVEFGGPEHGPVKHLEVGAERFTAVQAGVS